MFPRHTKHHFVQQSVMRIVFFCGITPSITRNNSPGIRINRPLQRREISEVTSSVLMVRSARAALPVYSLKSAWCRRYQSSCRSWLAKDESCPPNALPGMPSSPPENTKMQAVRQVHQTESPDTWTGGLIHLPAVRYLSRSTETQSSKSNTVGSATEQHSPC